MMIIDVFSDEINNRKYKTEITRYITATKRTTTKYIEITKRKNQRRNIMT
jgi:hypothetical protein